MLVYYYFVINKIFQEVCNQIAIRHALHLDNIPRPCAIMPCSAIDGIGLSEGLKWLSETLQMKILMSVCSDTFFVVVVSNLFRKKIYLLNKKRSILS